MSINNELTDKELSEYQPNKIGSIINLFYQMFGYIIFSAVGAFVGVLFSMESLINAFESATLVCQ